MTTDHGSNDLASAAAYDRAHTPYEDTWPEAWGDRPKGWGVYDEVPTLDEVQE